MVNQLVRYQRPRPRLYVMQQSKSFYRANGMNKANGVFAVTYVWAEV